LGYVVYFQLVHNARTVRFDGFGADMQAHCRLFGCLALGEKLQDLALSLTEHMKCRFLFIWSADL